MSGQTISIIAACVLLAVVIAGCAGFDMGDVIRVKTPQAMQTQAGLPETMTLNDAQDTYQLQLNGMKAWKENIQDGEQFAGLINQLTLDQFNALGPQLGGIPIVGPTLVGALPLATYFFGTRRMRKEKEKSYNAGLEKGNALSGDA